MVIISSDGKAAVHFENLVSLNILEFSSGSAKLLAQVTADSDVTLVKASPDYCKHIFSGILQAYFDNVKILYLPEKEKAYGLAIGEVVRGFGVPENPMPLNPSNLAESFDVILKTQKKKGVKKNVNGRQK